MHTIYLQIKNKDSRKSLDSMLGFLIASSEYLQDTAIESKNINQDLELAECRLQKDK